MRSSRERTQTLWEFNVPIKVCRNFVYPPQQNNKNGGWERCLGNSWTDAIQELTDYIKGWVRAAWNHESSYLDLSRQPEWWPAIHHQGQVAQNRPLKSPHTHPCAGWPSGHTSDILTLLEGTQLLQCFLSIGTVSRDTPSPAPSPSGALQPVHRAARREGSVRSATLQAVLGLRSPVLQAFPFPPSLNLPFPRGPVSSLPRYPLLTRLSLHKTRPSLTVFPYPSVPKGYHRSMGILKKVCWYEQWKQMAS